MLNLAKNQDEKHSPSEKQKSGEELTQELNKYDREHPEALREYLEESES